MREEFNHLYLDSHERKLLIHSLVEWCGIKKVDSLFSRIS